MGFNSAFKGIKRPGCASGLLQLHRAEVYRKSGAIRQLLHKTARQAHEKLHQTHHGPMLVSEAVSRSAGQSE